MSGLYFSPDQSPSVPTRLQSGVLLCMYYTYRVYTYGPFSRPGSSGLPSLFQSSLPCSSLPDFRLLVTLVLEGIGTINF